MIFIIHLTLERTFAKILFISIFIFLYSCNSVKRVPKDQFLLTKNTIYVDSVKTGSVKLYNQLYQKPNAKLPLVNIPLRLHIYNLASVDKDSSYQAWLHKKPNRKRNMARLLSQKQVDRLGSDLVAINSWIRKTGEAPSIFDDIKTKKSANKLKAYYWNQGWFNASVDYTIEKKKKKKAKVKYYLKSKQPYIFGTLKTEIESSVADSIYQLHKENSLIKQGQQFKTETIEKERDRLTKIFRNSGLFHFEKEYITFDADTVNTNYKVQLNMSIKNRTASRDSLPTIPFKVHRISKVNVFTDYTNDKKNIKPKDTIIYRDYHIYSYDYLKFTRKAITNSVLIFPDKIYRDQDRTITYNQINNLKVFKYPNIQYRLDPSDPNQSDLIADVRLTMRKKYSVNVEFDVSTSNIQAFGIGFRSSLLIRNLFKGAELLEISPRGTIGSSRDAVNNNDNFFDITEIGLDFKLSFPKIVFPFNINKIIPKYMSPTTNLIFSIDSQENIGLDRQTATGIFNYQWKPNKTTTNQIDIINIQYVRNLNTNNYFNVYRKFL